MIVTDFYIYFRPLSFPWDYQEVSLVSAIREKCSHLKVNTEEDFYSPKGVKSEWIDLKDEQEEYAMKTSRKDGSK